MDMNTILAAFNKITSESMGMAGGSHTAMDSGKKCSSCGNRIEGSGKTTEQGDVICADCDQHYAIGGPGEHEVDEAAMCEQCGQSPCQCESVSEGSDMEPMYGYEFPEGGRYGYKYDDDVPKQSFASGTAHTQPLLIYDKETGKTLSIPDFTYFDEDPDQDMLAELVFYSDETPENYSVNEGQCSNCGADPCVCESMSEGFGTTMRKYVPGLGKMTAKRRAEKAGQASSDAIDRAMDKPFDDIEGRKSDEQEFYTQGKRKDRYSKIANGMSEGFRRELADIQRLAECGEMYMPIQAQATSGMNVTTNVDSKTGTKTVTVSADGAGAEELMRVLANAGIAVAPMMSDMHQGMAEEVANHPAPQTLDTQTVMNQGEDLNRIKWQGNGDRARDNSMTFNEDVTNLANSLRRQFMESDNSNKFDTWTIGITYTLKELKKMGADASFIQDDADDPDEYAETPYVMDKNTQKPLIIKSKPIKWTSFKDPNPDLDEDRRQFMENKFAAKFDTWTVMSGGRKYTLKQLTNMGADVSFIQDDAYDPAEYADEKFVMDIKTQEPLIVPNGNGKPIKWTSFENPNPEEDYEYPEEYND